jgi:hypothetical protein
VVGAAVLFRRSGTWRSGDGKAWRWTTSLREALCFRDVCNQAVVMMYKSLAEGCSVEELCFVVRL